MNQKKFIPKEKLSKRARKAMNAQRRVLWSADPRTRVIPDKRRKIEEKNALVKANDLDEGVLLWENLHRK